MRLLTVICFTKINWRFRKTVAQKAPAVLLFPNHRLVIQGILSMKKENVTNVTVVR